MFGTFWTLKILNLHPELNLQPWHLQEGSCVDTKGLYLLHFQMNLPQPSVDTRQTAHSFTPLSDSALASVSSFFSSSVFLKAPISDSMCSSAFLAPSAAAFCLSSSSLLTCGELISHFVNWIDSSHYKTVLNILQCDDCTSSLFTENPAIL